MTDSKIGKFGMRVNLPKGAFVWPKLNKPDEYLGKSTFNVKVALDDDSTCEFLDSIAEVIELAKAEGAAGWAAMKPAAQRKLGDWQFVMPGTEEYGRDEMEAEPTGRILFNTKTASHTKQGVLKSVPMFGPDGKRLQNVEVWSGTIGIVSVNAKPYFMSSTGKAGISLYLNAVQILELRNREHSGSSGGGGGGDVGFAAVSGYDSIESGAAPAAPAVADDSVEAVDAQFNDSPDF